MVSSTATITLNAKLTNSTYHPGIVRRRSRRDLRRIPLLPRRPDGGDLPPGVCQAGEEPARFGLFEGEQEYYGFRSVSLDRDKRLKRSQAELGLWLWVWVCIGVEARVPFLDKKFLEVAMNIDAKYKLHDKNEKDEDGKGRIEKVSLRS